MHSSPPPLRETVVRSIQVLRVQHNKLEQASYRFKEKDKSLFQTCVRALEAKNKERAAIYANEIAEVRNLMNFLYHVELAIERVILRLETINELSEIVIDLKPALKLLQRVSQELFQVLPDISSELNNVNDTISETLYSTKITADESVIPVERKTAGGEEVLSEVSSFLEQRLSRNLPEPPATHKIQQSEGATLEEMLALATNRSETKDCKISEESGRDSSQTLISYKKSEIKEISLKVENPQFEDVLLDYVKKSNGKIDLERCSIELERSNDEIEKALESLGSKGKIRVELKAGE
jgi:division protein CdvB (Snf7/Vps24/ESCRT-III family)